MRDDYIHPLSINGQLMKKDARIAVLEAALKPFADANQFIIMFGVQWVKATEDDFRNARAALKGEKE